MNNRSIRIPEDLLYALQIIAEQEDRSVSDCIRQAIKLYADRMLPPRGNVTGTRTPCEPHGNSYCFPCWEKEMYKQFPNPSRAWND